MRVRKHSLGKLEKKGRGIPHEEDEDDNDALRRNGWARVSHTPPLLLPQIQTHMFSIKYNQFRSGEPVPRREPIESSEIMARAAPQRRW